MYVVSTPIGNLGDISYRAVEILQKVDLIAAEDTRRAAVLAKKYDIRTQRISYHEHNARKRAPELVKNLKTGKDVALISDAGTPGISDPGYVLINSCITNSISIIPVPGASAILAALVVSGLPTDRFVFEGFLPAKKGRKKKLENLASEKRTIVFYESPHRIIRTLRDLLDAFGDRKVVLARELTKVFEEITRKNLSELQEHFSEKKPKGEFVIVVHGAAK
ncbi:16S rRNA (cytidine(1402)-2'-O)-methyltransferase [candidate division KSB1 bacterium]